MNLVRQKLEGQFFDAVYSSPLSRCTKLACSIFPESQIRIDQRLTELDFGDWEMAEWNSMSETPEGKAWFADYVNTHCPNGESLLDLMNRSQSFLAALSGNSFSHVLVFTHAGIIRSMMSLLQHKTPEEAFNTPLEYGQIVTFNPEP